MFGMNVLNKKWIRLDRAVRAIIFADAVKAGSGLSPRTI